MNESTKSKNQWTNNEFLDSLRQESDRLADGCFEALKERLEKQDFGDLFKTLNANDQPLPDNGPELLRQFMEETTMLPLIDGQAIDFKRIQRGEKVFMTQAFPSALVLLTKALPSGYAAPNLSTILCLSDNLSKHPYRRLLGVLQMVVNACAVGGFQKRGKAIITIPKVRLLHAGIRHITRQHLPNYEKDYGVPLNLEDMLATIMGFSYLVITGLQQLDIGLTAKQAEDLYYLWRVFAQMMGIHPDNEPNSSAFVPADLNEAKMFYDSYSQRHYVDAADNPDGLQLAKTNLQMLNDLLPQTPLRRLGLKIVPRIYMEQLMGRDGCARIGLQPVRFIFATNWLLKRFPGLWSRLWNVTDRFDPSSHHHENLSRIFFQGLINRELNGEITFRIPDSLKDVRELA